MPARFGGAKDTQAGSVSQGLAAGRSKQEREAAQGLSRSLRDARRVLGYAPPPGARPSGGGPPRPSGPPALLPGQASGKNKNKAPAKPKGEFEGDQTALSNELRDKALGVMRGNEGRYGPEQVAAMKDQLFAATLGRVRTDIRAADAGAARRGMFRSGMANRTENDLRANALTAYSTGVKDIMIKKMEAEFQDKMAGLQAVQQWLGNKQNYELGKERDQIARAQIAASMAAAQLSATVQRESIAASRGAASAQMRFAEAGRAMDTARFLQQRADTTGPGGMQFSTFGAS